MSLDPNALEALKALALGLAFSGLLASTFELFTENRASFKLLEKGGVLALMSVPVLVFSGPFIILRNTIKGRSLEARPIPFVMVATMIAGGWSLLCGRLVLNVAGIVSGAGL